MDGHFLGNSGQNSGQGGQGQKSGDSASSATGTSLAVRQFVDLASHWVAVHAPVAPWAVVSATAEERYCLGCFGVRHFDVMKGKCGEFAAFCRCCGKEM